MARLGVIAAGCGLLVFIGLGWFVPVGPEGYTIPQLNELCIAGFFDSTWASMSGRMLYGDNWEQLIAEECDRVALSTGGMVLLGIAAVGLLVAGGVLKSPKKSTTVCSYCNFVGQTEAELLDHQAKNHLDKSPYKCEHCDFIGITEEILWNHYNDKHPDEKKW